MAPPAGGGAERCRLTAFPAPFPKAEIPSHTVTATQAGAAPTSLQLKSLYSFTHKMLTPGASPQHLCGTPSQVKPDQSQVRITFPFLSFLAPVLFANSQETGSLCFPSRVTSQTLGGARGAQCPKRLRGSGGRTPALVFLVWGAPKFLDQANAALLFAV